MAKAKTTYKFFISYRRDDYPDIVEHIRSWFAWQYGRANVFMDFDSIPVGATFPDHIKEEIRTADVMLVIITPNWLKRILDDPFSEEDWVRIEVSEALKQEKIVVPVFIKSAPVPDRNKLPPELRGILNIQGAWLDSGQNFIYRIESAIQSIEGLLDKKYARRKELQQMQEISPAPGVALGYYYNFLKRVGDQLVIFNNKTGKQPGNVQLTVDDVAVNNTEPVSMRIIIPPRARFLYPAELEKYTKHLSKALIQTTGFGRPMPLYAHKTGTGYELIDMPTAVSVLDYWLKRKMEEEDINPESEKAAELEETELDRFTKALTYYIDDHSNDPLFKDYIRPARYDASDKDLEWLKTYWG